MESEHILALLVVGSLLVIVVAAAIAYSLRAARKVSLQYRLLAKKQGWEYEEAPAKLGGLMPKLPQVSGEYRGREVAVFSKGYGMDNTRQTDTAVRMATNAPDGLKWTLSPRNVLGKLGQMARGEEVQTGDAEFDRRYILRGNNAGAVKGIFQGEAREQVESVLQGASAFLTLREGVLMYVEFGLIMDEERRHRVESVLALMANMADAMEGLR